VKPIVDGINSVKPVVQCSPLPDRIDNVKPAVHWFVEEHVDHLLNRSAHKSRFYTDCSQILKDSQLTVSMIVAENSHGESIFARFKLLFQTKGFINRFVRKKAA
jgi:hypothetical protein